MRESGESGGRSRSQHSHDGRSSSMARPYPGVLSRAAASRVPGDMEHVWDYPRPPAVEPCRSRVRVELGGELLADSTRALRVLETSHPPTIYIPPGDVRMEFLPPSAARSTWCE